MTPPAVNVRFTGQAEGDLGHAGRWVEVDDVDPGVASRRAAVSPLPWTWLRQVHGNRVVTVTAPGEHAGASADAAVTAAPGCVLAVFTADCAPVALVSEEGMVGVVHAGWRGLLAGVVEAAMAAMTRLGATNVGAVIGPCIHAECYEFGAADLDRMAARFGAEVRGVTREGQPALDLPRTTRVALEEAGAAWVDDVGVCTACAPGYWSHRARGDKERQALVAWISPSD